MVVYATWLIFTRPSVSFLKYARYTHPRNYTKAFGYYKDLAATGNATAQQMVGFMYATGIGGAVPRDQAQALLYHTFAAHGGDTLAEMTLGYRYLLGIGTDQKCEDAVYYYQKVAEKGMKIESRLWERNEGKGENKSLMYVYSHQLLFVRTNRWTCDTIIQSKALRRSRRRVRLWRKCHDRPAAPEQRRRLGSICEHRRSPAVLAVLGSDAL